MYPSPVELVGPPLGGRVVLTCEHASPAVPAPWVVPQCDRRWLRTHWAYDRGAAELTRALAERLGCPAVLSTFTRLLADPNRPPRHPDLCRRSVEGHALKLNHLLPPEEVVERVVRLHAPFHGAVDALIEARRAADVPTFVFSVHSFTSNYQGQIREVELGVLFDESGSEEATSDAGKVLASLRSHRRWNVQANAPWSGMDGLIYSVARHGRAHGARYLELEVRDDLLTGPDSGGPHDPVPTNPSAVSDLAEAVAQALRMVSGG